MSDNAAIGRELLDLLESAVDRGVFSGAQIEVGTLGGATLSQGLGSTADIERVSLSEQAGEGANHGVAADDIAQPVTRATLFDVASVTKAVVTSIVCMRAVELGKLDLEQPIGQLLPDRLYVDPGLAERPLESLLRHRSGLDAWHPFYENVGPDEVATTEGLELIRTRVANHGVRPDQGEVYSDLGYILLDVILEEAFGLPLDLLFIEHVAEPLGLERSQFVPVARGAQPLGDVAATEVVAWRGGLVRGVVHDGNTWAMGGVSGHAGLFSTATEIGVIARAVLAADAHGLPWLEQAVLHEFWDRKWRGEDGHYVLGWDTPSGELSSAGATVNRDNTVGHLGFTGCSLWIDRVRQAYVVLLTNRVHPSRDDTRIRELRPKVHEAAWALVDRNLDARI